MELYRYICFIYHSLYYIHTLGFLISGVIERVGNPIQASPSGSKWNRTAFLLVHEVPQDGVVFAFSAFFLHAKPVQFEIWRPTADVNKFKLIGGWTFTAVVQNNIEIVSTILGTIVSGEE